MIQNNYYMTREEWKEKNNEEVSYNENLGRNNYRSMIKHRDFNEYRNIKKSLSSSRLYLVLKRA